MQKHSSRRIAQRLGEMLQTWRNEAKQEARQEYLRSRRKAVLFKQAFAVLALSAASAFGAYKISIYSSEQRPLVERINSLEGQLAQLSSEKNKLNQDYKQKELEAASAEYDNRMLRQQYEKLSAEKDKFKRRIEALESGELGELNRQLRQKEEELNAIKKSIR